MLIGEMIQFLQNIQNAYRVDDESSKIFIRSYPENEKFEVSGFVFVPKTELESGGFIIQIVDKK